MDEEREWCGVSLVLDDVCRSKWSVGVGGHDYHEDVRTMVRIKWTNRHRISRLRSLRDVDESVMSVIGN